MSTDGIDISPAKDGGVLKTILKEGVGEDTPPVGSKVTVHYEGKLEDGTVFDSSRGRELFDFDLGQGHVIKAWDIGVATMKKGEIARLVCAPAYAYGKAGSPPKIPPNATLIFEVELFEWQLEDLSPNKNGGIIRVKLECGEQGASPEDGSLVEAQLVGEYNGVVFDERNVSFTIGEAAEENVCSGIEIAIQKFKKGEKSELQLSPKFAFGSEGKPEFSIPPDAKIKYTVTLNNFTKLPEAWCLDNADKLEQAKLFKDRGTKYFNEGKYSLAAKVYLRMLNYIEHDVGFKGEMDARRIELLKAMYLNMALCHLKEGDNVEARHRCEKCLELDPTNVKAWFRKAQSYQNMADMEPAINDFERVLEIDPNNSAAAKEIAKCKNVIKSQRAKEKQIFANMFERFAKHDEQDKAWVHGWWDGKTVRTEKYVPEKTDEETQLERKREREALMKQLQQKKKEMDEERRKLGLADENEDEKTEESSSPSTAEERREQCNCMFLVLNQSVDQPELKLNEEWETTQEWSRQKTNFEKENPNILMLDETGDFKNM